MIRVLLFGGLQDRAGWREKSLSFTGTLNELRETLEKSHGLSAASDAVLFAIDGVFAQGADTIPADAEVAIMPPVSGG